MDYWFFYQEEDIMRGSRLGLGGIVVIAAALFPVVTAEAVVNVPGDAATIQAGIDMAAAGEMVLLADGTYTGDGNYNIDFNGKAATVVSVNGPSFCIIDCLGASLDPRRGFLFTSGETSGSRLEGVTVQNGYCTGGSSSDGGGSVLIMGSSPTIIDCIFRQGVCNSHSGGGAMYIYDGEPSIVRCIFMNNISVGSGGAIETYNARPRIIDCHFRENRAIYNGGALYFMQLDPLVSYCTFTDNVAGTSGGAICAFLGYGSSTSCIMDGNEAARGGAMCVTSGYYRIGNCLMIDNYAFTAGGALYIDSPGEVFLNNTTIFGNKCNFNGGGICIGPSAYLEMLNCVVYGDMSLSEFGHSIAFHPGALVDGGTLVIDFCDVEGGRGGVYSNEICTVDWGGSNFDLDPAFVTGPGGGFYLAHTATGHIADSPCVDNGSDDAGMVAYSSAYWTLDDSLVERAVWMAEMVTRNDQVVDTGVVDVGFHYPPLPVVTPTPVPTDDLWVELALSDTEFQPGEQFSLTARIINIGSENYQAQPFVVLLDLYGAYYWHPDWTTEMHWTEVDIGTGVVTLEIVNFVWPNGAGSGSGTFSSAVLNDTLTEIIGGWANAGFNWQP
ncbi:hypothetical protein JW905_00935 [bacterium]|nr:hypothetical protein [candidate division CSSED10-310 bacterium]